MHVVRRFVHRATLLWAHGNGRCSARRRTSEILRERSSDPLVDLEQQSPQQIRGTGLVTGKGRAEPIATASLVRAADRASARGFSARGSARIALPTPVHDSEASPDALVRSVAGSASASRWRAFVWTRLGFTGCWRAATRSTVASMPTSLVGQPATKWSRAILRSNACGTYNTTGTTR